MLKELCQLHPKESPPHTQSQRMATMREEFILWMDISLHPSSTSQRWWTFFPYFLFLLVHQIDPPSLLWPVRPNFAFCRHTHRVSGGERGGKEEVCTLGRLSLKGLLTRNSTKQNPSDHASALYYNMLCVQWNLSSLFFCVSLFFYFWRSSSLEFFFWFIIIILFHIFCGALFWFSIALLKSLLVMSALMDLYHQNLWC